MKAVTYERYGPPEVLNLTEVPKPVPKKNEILVKIHATSVTAGDWRMRKADPFLARIFNGLFKPRRIRILGFEVAGVVEDVGSEVTSFKKGDAVFAGCGFKFGGYAEYTCIRESDLIAHKPANMTFEEAATVPIGGITALRLLRQCGLKQNDNVLVYGASGSVGTFAVQIVKALGGTVTAVCSTANVQLMKELGADEVIDYKTTDFTKHSSRFDIVLDAVGKTSKSACGSLLKPQGKYTSVAGNPRSGHQDLLFLKGLIENGILRSIIDRTYKLEDIREAHAYVESFRKKGNVAVTVVQP